MAPSREESNCSTSLPLEGGARSSKLDYRRTPQERMVRIGLRLAVGLLFVAAGVSKLGTHAETTALLGSHHLPAPALLAVLVGLGEALGGLLIACAWRVRWVAIILGLFVIGASILFHFPSALVGRTAFEFGLDVSMVIALYAIGARDPSIGEKRP